MNFKEPHAPIGKTTFYIGNNQNGLKYETPILITAISKGDNPDHPDYHITHNAALQQAGGLKGADRFEVRVWDYKKNGFGWAQIMLQAPDVLLASELLL